MILTKEQSEKRLTSERNFANKVSNFSLSTVSSSDEEIETNDSILAIQEVSEDSSDLIVPTVIVKDGINNHKGKNGSKNLSDSERVSIGVLASVTDAKTAAEIFGISPSHVNDLKNGNRNIGNGDSGSSLRIRDIELQNQIQNRLNKTKLTIQERAAEKLLSTLGLFDESDVQDKLRNSKPREISQVANQMSQVFRNMNSSNSGSEGNAGNKNKVTIVMHQPKQSKEEHFDVIEIGVE